MGLSSVPKFSTIGLFASAGLLTLTAVRRRRCGSCASIGVAEIERTPRCSELNLVEPKSG